MNKEQIAVLKEKYRQNQLSPKEEEVLLDLIAQGRLTLEDFDDLSIVDQTLDEALIQAAPEAMDRQFYHWLAQQNRTRVAPQPRPLLSARWLAAAASFLLLLGLGLGYFVVQDSREQVRMIGAQMAAMQEDMMLALLDDRSPSHRLQAVSITKEMQTVSETVAEALLYTINHDESDNVRMAGIEALVPYAEDERVRSGLVQSIRHQHSPLVLLTLAEALKAIGANSTLEEFQRQLHPDLPDELRSELETGLKVLL